ncbi:acyl-CoA dehydrogenase family protein [Marinomonas sp. TI.3.20]|uniref:acyl-CoA dehydrogenase family protein n=1 Tax=Marinomonas sp. TI.3.20 TaxID=3121296 RepID=UPI00311F1256
MYIYKAPYKDMVFLSAMVYQQHLSGVKNLSEFDPQLASNIMDEAEKFASKILSPLNFVGDHNGCRFENGRVITPTGWKEAYQAFCQAGWVGLTLPVSCGGQGLPRHISQSVNEMWLSSNLAWSMLQALTQSGANILSKFANESMQRRYLSKLVSGEWTVAIALTESNAGSDLGALTTKAFPRDDGTYQILGQKIFITYGEHDLTKNILHLVLACTPDAPNGSRSASLFLVPKYRVNDDGIISDFNDVTCTGIERKLGLHGSPTCSIQYGENNVCIGELVGELHQGLKAISLFMNEARLSCGLQGVALAQLGYQKASEYASQRKQGYNNYGHPVTIIEHADVKRMLLEIRSESFALRALGYQIAAWIDCALANNNVYIEHNIALLIPIFKAFSTERANALIANVVQIFGGMGVIEEVGIAQILRDARVLTIYEGTTGIQALDLVFKKILADQGATLFKLINSFEDQIKEIVQKKHLIDFTHDLPFLLEESRAILYEVVLSLKTDIIVLQEISAPLLESLGIIFCSFQLLKITDYSMDVNIKKNYPGYFENTLSLTQFYLVHRLPIAIARLKTVRLSVKKRINYNFD